MSYYDHATMMAYRLGPWAEHPGEPRTGEDRGLPYRSPLRFSRFLQRLIRRLGPGKAAGIGQTGKPGTRPTHDAKGDERCKTC